MEKLDVEHLQKLTYDRSNTWSSFFEVFENDPRVVRLEDLNFDLDVSKLETVPSPTKSDESNDDLASMEDDDYVDKVDSEFLQNASSHTQFSMFNGSTTMDLLAMTKNDEEKQYVDVINKTLPVFNAHNRQLKEFGFDKVLISFKKDEIENKFGTWLNRHNSLFVGDNSVMSDCNKTRNLVSGREATTNGKSTFNNEEFYNDSDASLQSGETARYIRSSRVGSIKNSTTTLIKTYRMVRSTRAAVHDKYAYETDDDDDYHGNDPRLRKNRNTPYKNHYEITPFGRPRKNENLALKTKTDRRKVLRKRVSNSSGCADASSSDSDYSYENYHKSNRRKLKSNFTQYQCFAKNYYKTPLTTINKNNILKTCSNIKMPSAMRNRFYYFSRAHSMSVSSSSPSSSFNSMCEKRRAIKRGAELSKDLRPRKRESECCCYNDKQLCKKFNHVADSSADDWYVESGCSKKPFKTPQTKPQTTTLQKSKSCQSKRLQTADTEHGAFKSKKNLNGYKNTITKEHSSSGTDLELQMALKESLELYKYEKEKRHKKSHGKLLKSKNENLSKEIAVKNDKKVVRKTEKDSEVLKISRNKSNEETLFAPAKTHAVYNSTALYTEGRAFQRQFADKHQQIVEDDETESSVDDTIIHLSKSKIKAKPAKKKLTSTRISGHKDQNGSTVTSTTLRSPDLHLSATLPKTNDKQIKQNDDIKCDDQNDVTSTTNVEIPLSNTTSNILENCILIYDPENRSMISANSITNDGCFTVTKEHLSAIIGEKAAQKFFRYYVGRKRFELNKKVYYKPPSNSFQRHNLSSSSESTDDLDNMGLYGDLFCCY